MELATRNEFGRLAQELHLRRQQVEQIVQLLDEGNTVPFIARFRKEQTGNLDEDQIRNVQRRMRQMRQLAERKQTVVRTIEAQGLLTDELKEAINSVTTAKRLEDLYLSYKPKKQTLATIARQRGLGPLAEAIWSGDETALNLDELLPGMIDPDKQLATVEDVLTGVQHILAEKIAENAEVRDAARQILRNGKLVTNKAGSASAASESDAHSDADDSDADGETDSADGTLEGSGAAASEENAADAASTEDATGLPQFAPEEESTDSEPTPAVPAAVPGLEAHAEFRNYLDFSESVRSIPPHRVLAINRAEKLGVVRVRIEADREGILTAVWERLAISEHAHADFLRRCVSDALERLLYRSLEREMRGELTELAEQHAVGVFARNLRSLLLQAPVPSRKVLAIDPGYRTGCKYVVLDEFGVVLQHGVLYPHLKRKKKKKKKRKSGAAPAEATETAIAPSESAAAEAAVTPSETSAASVSAESASEVPPAAEGSVGSESVAPESSAPESTASEPAAEEQKDNKPADGSSDAPVMPADSVYRSTSDDSSNSEIDLEGEIDSTPEASDEHGSEESLGFEPDPTEASDKEEEGDEHDDHDDGTLQETSTSTGSEGFFPPDFPLQLSRRDRAKMTLASLCNHYGIELIAIGNGTACRETEELISEMIAESCPAAAYIIVNEAGASVYSTSAVGREEFPDFDASLRSTISIGRRLQDPLSELVKIDPQSIGVGLYQHDINPRLLRDTLSDVVESCVNYVGVDLNTASIPLLQHVSGLNQLRARNLVEHRKANGPFKNREQIKEVAGIGPTVFTQAAGFLKITGGDQPFDSTWIHPESYPTALKVLELLEGSPADLLDRTRMEALRERVGNENPDKMAEMADQLSVGTTTIADILANLVRPGRDPREDLPPPVFRTGILRLEDLQPEMQLRGTVLNVVDFGVFVDIGLKDSGLVHISQIANRYIKSPHDVATVGDIVTTWVLSVDAERRRVSLTMIRPGEERSRHEGGRQRRGRRPEGEGSGQPGQGGGRRFGRRPPRGGAPAQGAPAGSTPTAEGQTAAPPQSDAPQQSQRGGYQGGGQHRQGGQYGGGQQGGGRGGRPGGGRFGQQPRGPQGRPQQQRSKKPDRFDRSTRNKPPVKLTDEKLEGKSDLQTFGELKALWDAKKKKKGEDGPEKS